MTNERQRQDRPLVLKLPNELYDAQNALVLCDTCDRPYHQRCHFVPILGPLPRGEWHCLLCTSPSQTTKQSKSSSSSSNNNNNNKKRTTTKRSNKKQSSTSVNLNHVYPFPPRDDEGRLLVDIEAQDEWEYVAATTKITAWKKEVSRLQRAISLQLQTIRLQKDALRAHTTSSRKSHHATLLASNYNPLKSQELCQCFFRLASSKLRIRQWLLSLETYRAFTASEKEWTCINDFVTVHPDQENVWFPYGRTTYLQRRIIPRCGHDNNDLEEEKEDNGANHNNSTTSSSMVPNEIIVKDSTNNNNNDDDDDMISLDDLRCCVCFRGDSTDDNDVLLCDGRGCYRAFHMNCVSPKVTIEQVENEDDWFCPVCTTMAKLLASTQSEYTGDEWVVYNDDDDETKDYGVGGNDGQGGGDAATIRSWEQAQDVFPEAEKEYEMAVLWKDGNHTEELAQFVSTMLGIPMANGSSSGSGSNLSGGDSQVNANNDDDDSDDDDFDLDAFQKQKQQDQQDDSVASSEASLDDLSSVENVDRNELDALSLPSDVELSNDEDEDEDDEQGSGGCDRRRRRTRSARSSRANSANNSDEEDNSSSSNKPDVGTLDESNIVFGRRRRNQVDYRKLNDSMFGNASVNEASNPDDSDDEFQYRSSSRRNSSSSSEDDSTRSSQSTEGSSDSSGGESDNSAKDSQKATPIAKKKRLSTGEGNVANGRNTRSRTATKHCANDPNSAVQAVQQSKRTKRTAKAMENDNSDSSAAKPRRKSRRKNSGTAAAMSKQMLSGSPKQQHSSSKEIRGGNRSMDSTTARKAKTNNKQSSISSKRTNGKRLVNGERKRSTQKRATRGNER